MYKLHSSLNHQYVIRLLDNACIPVDPDNTDYQQYLAWLSEDPTNQPLPADEVTV